jgi:hypothetical protein
MSCAGGGSRRCCTPIRLAVPCRAGGPVCPPDIINTAAASILTFSVTTNLINIVSAFNGVNHTTIHDVKTKSGIKKVLSIYMVFLVIARVGGPVILAIGHWR